MWEKLRGRGPKEFFLFPIGILVISVIKSLLRDFPRGSVAKTPFFQCRGPGFDPCRILDWIPRATTKSVHAAMKSWHSQVFKKDVF